MTTQYNLKIEHYILGKTLGVGAFGKVKLAKHEITQTNVAIKIINKKKMKHSKMSHKIKREIRLLRYFNHPNIIRLYEVLDTTTDIFVVMEYVPGGELFDLIAQKGRLSESEAKHYFSQLISGVEYCHQNLVTHRDLKPENVLIDENNKIKLADFGLSNLMKDGKFLKTSCGSPNYAAPEVVSAKPYSGTEVDTWSCGVILYALLAGYLPFDEDVIPKLFKKIRQAEYIMPNNFSPLAKDLIRKIFQVDPLDRIKFHQIKLHPWLNQEIPLSIEILGHQRVEKQKKINEELYQKFLLMDINFHDLSKEKIREALLKRKDYSFVIAYEMLQDQLKKKNQQESDTDKQQNFIFGGIHRILEESIKKNSNYFMLLNQDEEEQRNQEIIDDNHWVYGVNYPLHPRTIMKVIYECLGNLDTMIAIKSVDYKIKCYHKNTKNIPAFNCQIEMDQEHLFQPQEKFQPFNKNQISLKDDSLKHSQKNKSQMKKIEKYSKKEISFTIQIYSIPNTEDHVIDIQLNKGHPIIFIEFSNKFIFSLSQKLSPLCQ